MKKGQLTRKHLKSLGIKDKQKQNIFLNHSIEQKQNNIRDIPLPYRVYGEGNIESGAMKQMENAMSLLVSVKGALMSDAHEGYGLPIGGVLATCENIVIPYAVGVDIACRMCMSVFSYPVSILQDEKDFLIKAISNNTYFGVGSECKNHLDTSTMDDERWSSTKTLRDFKNLAFSQLGTSGGGNHFAEWGILEIYQTDQLFNLQKGSYLALLSHSGSRGFGARICETYSAIAREKIKLDKHFKHLAWLDLNTQEGQEYWVAMNLAGDYASANHHEIHNKISMEFSEKPLLRIENHHNFAWKEKLSDGTDVIVHRKGATPANRNSIGIIPGSMTQHGFVVKGKGNPESINSASHGAGRVLSRTKAFKTIKHSDLNEQLQQAGVTLIGGNVDEAPMVYKDIDSVMAYQDDLVTVLAKFTPKIVFMARK